MAYPLELTVEQGGALMGFLIKYAYYDSNLKPVFEALLKTREKLLAEFGVTIKDIGGGQVQMTDKDGVTIIREKYPFELQTEVERRAYFEEMSRREYLRLKQRFEEPINETKEPSYETIPIPPHFDGEGEVDMVRNLLGFQDVQVTPVDVHQDKTHMVATLRFTIPLTKLDNVQEASQDMLRRALGLDHGGAKPE